MKTGINYHCGYVLHSSESAFRVLEKLSFSSLNGTIECSDTSLFLYTDEKSVNSITFKTINDAFLVFDSALVIDSLFRTNDNFIFGAGTATEYTIKCLTNWNQRFNNSYEVGKQLAWFLILPWTYRKNKVVWSNQVSKKDLLIFQCFLSCNSCFLVFSFVGLISSWFRNTRYTRIRVII